MKKYILTITLLLFAMILISETSGNAGFQILKLSFSPVASAQAETGEFSEDFDASMYLLNPAATVNYNKKIISASYNRYFMDTNESSLGYINSTGKKAVGLGVRYFDYGKFERRDDTGTLIGEFHPMDLIATFNSAYRITPMHYVGINLSLLFEQIDTASSYGFSADLGYLYLSNIRGLRFAAAVKNLGFTSKMDEEKIKLPIEYKLSTIKDFKLSVIPISTQLSLIKYSDDNEIKINYGINATYRKTLTLRLGYKMNDDSRNISIGMGIYLKSFRIDYSYIPSTNELGDIHQIGVNYLF